MKAPREIKQWVNRLRKRHSKKNGVVPSFCFDSPEYEIKDANNKRELEKKWSARDDG